MTLTKETLERLKNQVADCRPSTTHIGVTVAELDALIAAAEELERVKAVLASTEAGDAMLLDNLERHLGKRPETIAEGIEQLGEQHKELSRVKTILLSHCGDGVGTVAMAAALKDDYNSLRSKLTNVTRETDRIARERDAWKADADTLASCIDTEFLDFDPNAKQALEQHERLMK
jgi:hypothetical protein